MSGLGKANQPLYNAAVIVLAFAVLGAVFGVEISQAGITVSPRRTDLPLLGGLLILFWGNYHYYTKIIEPQGETPREALVSLIGMLLMAFLPIIVLWEQLRPWRYLAIAVYGALVVVKNRDLSKKYREGDTALIYAIWSRRAMLQTGTCVLGGVLFLQLMHPRYRDALFHRIIDSPVIVFRPAYEMFVNLTFNSAFLAAILTLFLLHHQDLVDLKQTAGSVDRPGGTP